MDRSAEDAGYVAERGRLERARCPVFHITQFENIIRGSSLCHAPIRTASSRIEGQDEEVMIFILARPTMKGINPEIHTLPTSSALLERMSK